MNAARKYSFDGLFESMMDGLLDRVIEAIKENQGVTIPPNDLGIKLMRAYSAKEAAVFLGVDHDAVYRIPENELPRVRRVGIGKGILGIQILRYMHSLPPIDTLSITKELSDRVKESMHVTAKRATIKPISKNQKEIRLM